MKGCDRNDFDYYPTPKWAVKRLLERSKFPDGHWLEPCAGDGAIIRAVNEISPGLVSHWSANEIQGRFEGPLKDARASVTIGTFSDWKPSRGHQWPSVCISNPPYNQALDVIRWAIEDARIPYVAMFLRMGWAASAKRNGFMRAHKPDICVVPDRPQFWRQSKGKFQTDNCDYAWFVWHKKSGEVSILETTPQKIRKADALASLRFFQSSL